MAYVNVAEWSPEQVCDWIRGSYHIQLVKSDVTMAVIITMKSD